MNKKILITRFPYESVFSGEEIHTLLLAEKLREKKTEIFFMGSCSVLLAEFQKRKFGTGRFWGGRALVSQKSFWWFLITFPFVVLNFVRLAFFAKFHNNADLVYMLSLNEKLFLTPWLLLLKIKVVWIEHSRIGDWLSKNPFLFLYRFFSKFVKIISVSQTTKKQLIDLKIREQQIHFILNGVDFAILEKVDAKELAKWQEKKLGSDQTRTVKKLKIALITRLYHDKGIDYFVGAFRKLLEKYKNIEVFIVGEGPYKKELKFFAQDLPVTFLGKLEHTEIKYFLHSIDYFVLPSSVHDPFGLAPAEAMACQKPVIVTDVCGISEFMENEKNGLIIPAKNVKAIENALEKLLNNTEFAQKMAKNGYQLAKEKFSLERMVKEYGDIFK